MSIESGVHFESENSIRYISETSQEFEEDFRKRRPTGNRIFGLSEIEFAKSEIETMKRISSNEGKILSEEDIQKIWEEKLDMPQRALKMFFERAEKNQDSSFEEEAKYSEEFFSQSLKDPDISHAFKELGDTHNTEVSPQVAIDIFRRGELPTPLFKMMLEKHISRIEEKLSLVKGETTFNFQLFKDAIYAEIEAGRIPLSKELVDRRLESIKVSYTDPLETTGVADYDAKTREVRIGLQLNQEERHHALVHEYTHGLSGISLALVEENGLRYVEHKKTGLSFSRNVEYNGTSSAMRGQEHRWLNEALTEMWALRLEGRDENEMDWGKYQFERIDVLSLIRAGVPRELFDAAYFENHTPQNPNDEKGPAWQALASKIEEFTQSGYLKERALK
ncbi:MAG: hypothetical protein AAB515_03590 [Patescibacteria group bacterium]